MSAWAIPTTGRPVMLMFGNHHAREWPPAEAPMAFAYDLVDTFNASDARTVDLLDRAGVIIVPVSNPDGFDASRTSGDLIDLNHRWGWDGVDPGHARHRLQAQELQDRRRADPAAWGVRRQPLPGGYGIGVDLNRNYGALWGGPGADGATPGVDEDGSLGTGTNSPIYHGPAPISEP